LGRLILQIEPLEVQPFRYGAPQPGHLSFFQSREVYMLYYALGFLLIAIVAAVLGFGGIAFAAAGIAKILFYLFLVLFIVSLIVHLARGSSRV
jgi:uncharacterized membrane protein YtjA (UPF0391 family)